MPVAGSDHIAGNDIAPMRRSRKTSVGKRHQKVEHQRRCKRNCEPDPEICTKRLRATQVSGCVEVPRQRADSSRRSERVDD